MGLVSANDLDLNGHKLLNVQDGSSSGDGVNKGQLDANASADRNRANHTGTQLASTISNFTAAVQAIQWSSMLAPTGPVNFNSQKAENLLDPTNPQDGATKNYVDTALSGIVGGLKFKGEVQVAVATNVNISNPGTSTFDGKTITSGQKVLLTNQTTGSQNGPWVFNGSASAMTRPANFSDTTPDALVGSFWTVVTGTHDNEFVLLTNDTFTLGTDTAAFVFRGAAGGTDDDASYSANVGTGSAGPYVITHNLGTTDVDVVIRELSGGYQKITAWKPTSINAVSVEPDEVWATNSHRATVIKVV